MAYGIKTINDMPRGSCSYKDKDGNKHLKKFYRDWHNMLKRCYSGSNKTYSDCYVCDDWLILSNFKDWFDNNCVEGFQLDKDLLTKNNKEYGPETCNYIPHQLNKLFCNSGATKGEFPTGVSLDVKTGRYKARCVINSVETWHGRHDTPEQAENAYKKQN